MTHLYEWQDLFLWIAYLLPVQVALIDCGIHTREYMVCFHTSEIKNTWMYDFNIVLLVFKCAVEYNTNNLS